MRLAIFGSRTLYDHRVEMEIAQCINEHPEITTIVTADEPAGVCNVAQIYARKTVTPLQVHFLNPKRARGAFEARCLEILKFSDMALLIHDGESKGTANELEETRKAGKPYEYVVLEKSSDLDSRSPSSLSHYKKSKPSQGWIRAAWIYAN